MKYYRNIIKIIVQYNKYKYLINYKKYLLNYKLKSIKDLYLNSYLIFKNILFEILKRKKLIHYNKFKQFCLYTNKKRSIFIKYKMSRFKLKENLDNINYLNYF